MTADIGKLGPEQTLDLAQGPLTEVPVAAVGGTVPAYAAVAGQAVHDDVGGSDGCF